MWELDLLKIDIPTKINFQISYKIYLRAIEATFLKKQEILYLTDEFSINKLNIHNTFVCDDRIHRVVKFGKKIVLSYVYYLIMVSI